MSWTDRKCYVIFIFVRLASAFLVRTWFVADEYWQSLEVAHNLVFHYGFLTWEWQEGIRSYIYPLIIAFLYKSLNILNLDNVFFLIYVPRVFQSILSGVADVYTFKLLKTFGCPRMWSILTIVCNWFVFYCSSRTLINTFEASLVSIGLAHYPWSILTADFSKHKKKKISDNTKFFSPGLRKYIIVAGLSCVIRPTAATIWAPLFAYHLYASFHISFMKLLLHEMLPMAVAILTLSLLIDSLCYGRFIITQWNFFKFNYFHNISSFYGTHSVHWYLSQGIPVLLGVQILPFIFRIATILFEGRSSKHTSKKQHLHSTRVEKFMLLIIAFNVMVYSSLAHKEFRFLLSLVPLMNVISTKYFYEQRPKILNKVKKLWLSLYVIGFIVPSIYFGLFHQRGSLTVMRHLSAAALERPNNSYLFLMPCHSTPLYSHIHVNVTTRFLRCEPPLHSSSYDETYNFYSNPVSWLEKYWNDENSKDVPTHIISFDTLLMEIGEFLHLRGYELDATFHHTYLPESRTGRNVVVMKKR